MHLATAIRIGLNDIWAHRFRSALSMLGVILGVASLVAMAAIVKGMENGLKETMIAMGGADKVLLRSQSVPDYQEHLADEAPGRTMHDVRALLGSAPLIRVVSPEMSLDRVYLSRGEKHARPSECVGVWPSVLEMNLHTLEHGRFFTMLDEERASSVCVIGAGIRDELFGHPDETGTEVIPIGRVIRINGQPFTIVGMFERYESELERRMRELAERRKAEGREEAKTSGPKRRRGFGIGSGWAFWRKNYTVYIPLNTMWIRFRAAGDADGIPDSRLSDIDLKVHALDRLEPALQQARNVLMLTHRGIEDFTFQTQENQIDDIDKQIRNARLSGGLIAAISLIVGGIGIMNIMLASINERVREIGICKAVGATAGAVFIQVLIESVAVSLLGAAIGLVASRGLVHALSAFSTGPNTPVITGGAMLLAVAFSAAVGIVAGLFPALKAARLNPIEALRAE